jgi:acyl-CoA hydrolase
MLRGNPPCRITAGMFNSQERVFLPGASGTPNALADAVFATPDIHVTTSFAPGVNRLTSEMIGPGSIVTGLFMQPGLAAAQREGRFRHLPQSYAAMIKHLRAAPPFDCCIVQVSPPDADGKCSLGPAAEFTPEVLRRAGRIIAVVNPHVPRLAHAPAIALKHCAQIIEADTPITSYDIGAFDATSATIAALVASRIADGATIQTGLGKVPQALMAALRERRNIRIHSGMISDGIMALADAGALDPDWQHSTTALLGSPVLYDWLRDRTDIHVKGVEVTHDPARLAALPNFVALNSAVEVDLFGQCNLESVAGRAVSGVGGAADFAHAARLSPGGLSIIAMPAGFGSGDGSRIRPWLPAGSIVSLPRTAADLIVTEEGIADLRGLSVHERAAAIIAIASPAARPGLESAWREIAAKL